MGWIIQLPSVVQIQCTLDIHGTTIIYTAIECPPLNPITNGVITYATDTTPNYDHGTEATYDCDAGFVLNISLGGSAFRTCVHDNGLDAIGEFDRQAPTCIRK